MGWSVGGYRHIKNLHKKFATPAAPEPIMAKYVIDLSGKTTDVVTSYYWSPRIVGRRGFDGSEYVGRLSFLRQGLAQMKNLILLLFRKPSTGFFRT